MHQRFHVDAGNRLVPVGRVQIPEVFTVHLTDDDAHGPDVILGFEVRNGAPECRELRMIATDSGNEVRYSGIVGVRIEDVQERALREMLLGRGDYDENSGLHRWYDSLPAEAVTEARKARRARVTDAELREVADVYRANPRRPTAAVADHFGKAHRTAANWVERARKAGYLPPTTRGKSTT